MSAECAAERSSRFGLLPGDRVELVAVNADYARLEPGQRGTVAFTDSLGTVHIRWDDGSRLGIIAEAGDLIRKIGEPS
jgi:Domain of unknown function (DUF4314)